MRNRVHTREYIVCTVLRVQRYEVGVLNVTGLGVGSLRVTVQIEAVHRSDIHHVVRGVQHFCEFEQSRFGTYVRF